MGNADETEKSTRPNRYLRKFSRKTSSNLSGLMLLH